MMLLCIFIRKLHSIIPFITPLTSARAALYQFSYLFIFFSHLKVITLTCCLYLFIRLMNFWGFCIMLFTKYRSKARKNKLALWETKIEKSIESFFRQSLSFAELKTYVPLFNRKKSTKEIDRKKYTSNGSPSDITTVSKPQKAIGKFQKILVDSIYAFSVRLSAQTWLNDPINFVVH